jgi:hypothetical protein
MAIKITGIFGREREDEKSKMFDDLVTEEIVVDVSRVFLCSLWRDLKIVLSMGFYCIKLLNNGSAFLQQKSIYSQLSLIRNSPLTGIKF